MIRFTNDIQLVILAQSEMNMQSTLNRMAEVTLKYKVKINKKKIKVIKCLKAIREKSIKWQGISGNKCNKWQGIKL